MAEIPDRLAKHYGLALDDVDRRATECFETSNYSVARLAVSIRKKGDEYTLLRRRGCLIDLARSWFLQEIDDRELQFWSLRAHSLRVNKTFQKGGNLEVAEFWEKFYSTRVMKATEKAYQQLLLCTALHQKTKEIRHLRKSGTTTMWTSVPALSAPSTEPTLPKKRKSRFIEDE